MSSPPVRARAALVVVGTLITLLGSGCPKGNDKKPVEPSGKRDAGGHTLPLDDGGARAQLPPAPPLPAVPAGLPALPARPAITPERVALGELLFHDTRLSSTGLLACATCHDPARGFAGTRQPTAAGAQNLRRTPALVNLAWVPAFGWDGRYATVESLLDVHVRGQLGDALATSLPRVATLPLYRAHFERVSGLATPEAVDAPTATAALAAFVLTRYAPVAPWDRIERSPDAPPAIRTGYLLFTGKAQCATCHAPPLYTDNAYHRLGLIATPDEGRGRIDKAQAGAFRTPTLRGAARRPAWFHDGSATSLGEALDWHLAGGTGQGADPSIVDPALRKLALTGEERGALLSFVEALTAPVGPPPTVPALP